MRFWLALAAYALVDTVATIAAAKWIMDRGRAWLVLAFLCYVACTVAWLVGLSARDPPGVTKAYAIYPLYAMVMGVAAGLLVSEERLSTRGWIGVALGVAAILLILSDEKPST